MATMHFDVPHQLPQAEARARTGVLLRRLARKHGITVSVGENTATLSGRAAIFSFGGRVWVGKTMVVVELDGPPAVINRAGPMIESIRADLVRYLNPAMSLERLTRP